MDTVIIIAGLFVFLAWFLGRPQESPSRESKETLNEACPNDGTGLFAIDPMDDLER